MKILVLADSFLPHAGGSRVYYYNIYTRLASMFGHDIIVLTRKVPGCEEFDRSNTSQRLQIVRRQEPLPDWKYRQWPKAIAPLWDSWRIARSMHIDMVHAGDLFPPGLVSRFLKRSFGIPYLVYCHGEEITQTDRYRFQPLLRNGIYRRADGVIAASEFARKHLLRIGVSDTNIRKITGGVDGVRFAPGPRSPRLVERFSLQGKSVLLTVARLCARKGHDVALRAIAKIDTQFLRLHYLIVGKGPEEDRLRSLAAELGVTQNISFAGGVPDEELPEYYRTADLFVMPNREEWNGDIEGFGMVFLEANAAGKAVVGGRSGGAGEAILDGITGYQVDPTDADQLATTLKVLLENPQLRERMGAAGLKRAHSEFDWESRAASLDELSRDVLRKVNAPKSLPTVSASSTGAR